MRSLRVMVCSLMGLLLAGTGLAAPGTSSFAAPPPAATAPTCKKAAADEVSARLEAKRCRTRVEIESAGNERVQAFSNPDGTTSLATSAAPRRVRRADGSWAAVDRNLRASGGRIAPKAAVADVSFSPGGSAPMVLLRKGGHTLSLDWPGVLPAPTLSGELATYTDVLPGTDLVLRATTTGFSHVLVVRTAQAAANPALARIAYRIGGDATVSATAKGLVAKAADGTVLASTPTALMWDSSMQAPAGSAAEKAGLRPDPSTVDSPGDAARRSTLSVAVDAGALVVSADRTFLTDPARTLPIYVDPSWDADIDKGMYWGYTMYPETENGDGRAWVGLDPWWGQVYRSYFEFPTSVNGISLIGKHILSAQFNITLSHSYSCGPSPVYLWWTDHIYSWGHVPWAPYLNGYVQEGWANANKAGDWCAVQPDVPMGFTGANKELTSYVQAIVNASWGSFALGLAAFDPDWNGEYDQSRWKKFHADTAVLWVNFNSYPNSPDTFRTNPSSGCQSTVDSGDTASLPRLNVNNAGAGLALRTNLSDPDYGVVQGRFEVWPKATKGSAGIVYNGPFTAMAASGSTFESTVPAGTLADGTAYSWRTHASDGIDYSGWSPWCEFVADSSPPGPPQVTSAELNGQMAPTVPGTPTGVVKVARPSPVTFTPAAGTPAGEIAGYVYGLNTATKWAPADASGAATVMVEPLTSGFTANKLVVIAVDRAGNRSALPSAGYTYSFKANAGTAAWWPTRNSASPLVDVAAAKNMTITGTGSVGYGTATFGGGQAATTGQVLTTSASFTVAAWVRLTSGGATRAIVSQAGTTASAFYLQYEAAGGKWRFALPKTNVAAPVFVEVKSSQPAALDTWVHLAAVYDSVAKQIRLYVNGSLDGTVAYTTAHWSATGKFRIGQEQVNAALVNPFAGDIADVRAWGSIMDVAAIAGIAKLPPSALEWGMDDPGALQLADTSGLAAVHNGTLSGSPSMAPGHRGYALAVNGAAPSGATTTSVVHTNASFSVSAWVRASQPSSGYLRAISADGAAVGLLGIGIQPDNRWACWMSAYDGVASEWVSAVADSGATAGVWAHLATTYNVQTKQLALYVNGTLAATVTMTTPWDAQRFAVGFSRWNGADTSQWQGDIDDVRAFQGVLSPTQIAYLATL